MIKFSYPETITPDKNLKNLAKEIRSDQMSGWLDLPLKSREKELAKIKKTAAKIQSDSDYLLCIGIGGSYLGHRALIEALGNPSKTKILYIGNSLDPFTLNRTLKKLADKDFSINIISKSGTTTEPAIAFRIFKAKLIEKYGKQEAYQRIYATTDAEKGALHDEAVKNGYETFVIPDNIGGRYSVLTSVGLLPVATAGLDLDEILAGAREEAESLKTTAPEENPAYLYATFRQKMYREGFTTEVLASFTPSMYYFNEWWKQLFGESEGKNHQGIFPASVVYTTDLHSLGQYLQEGRRDLFETVVQFSSSRTDQVKIPSDPENLDHLNYLAGETLAHVNHQALEGTILAHRAGGLPVAVLKTPPLNAKTLGALIYFFELSCALSAKLSGVNPFDQPGVEAYKTEMFRLLGK